MTARAGLPRATSAVVQVHNAKIAVEMMPWQRLTVDGQVGGSGGTRLQWGLGGGSARQLGIRNGAGRRYHCCWY